MSDSQVVYRSESIRTELLNRDINIRDIRDSHISKYFIVLNFVSNHATNHGGPYRFPALLWPRGRAAEMVPQGALTLGEPRAALTRSAWAGATERGRENGVYGGEMVRRG